MQATILAIQFELGMSDDATGAVGPLTRAGLRQHPLAVGSTGVWVNLFSTGMVLNGRASFTDTFGEDMACAVREFQSLSALPVSGRADLATWAQTMVSTGDPDRPGAACDCVTTITPERTTRRPDGPLWTGQNSRRPGALSQARLGAGEVAERPLRTPMPNAANGSRIPVGGA